MGEYRSGGTNIRTDMEPYVSGSNVNSASSSLRLSGTAVDSGYAKSYTTAKAHERASFGDYRETPSVYVAKKGYLPSKNLLTSISSASTRYLVYASSTDSWYLSSTSGSASGTRLSTNGNRHLFNVVLCGGGGGGGGGVSAANSGGGGSGGATLTGYLLLEGASGIFPTNTRVIVGGGGAKAENGNNGSNGTETRVVNPSNSNLLFAGGGNGGKGGNNGGSGGAAQSYVSYVSSEYYLKSIAGGAGGAQTKVGTRVLGGSMFDLSTYCGIGVTGVSYSGGSGGTAPSSNGGGGGGASAFGSGGKADAATAGGTGAGGAGGGNAWFQSNPGTNGGAGYFAIYY